MVAGFEPPLRLLARSGARSVCMIISLEIDATSETVWASLEEISSHVEWMKDAESIRFRTDSHTGVGTVFECATRVGPIRLTDVMSVTEWVPRQSMGVEHRGRRAGSGTLQPRAGGLARAPPACLGRRTSVSLVAGRTDRRTPVPSDPEENLAREPCQVEETRRESLSARAVSCHLRDCPSCGARCHCPIGEAATRFRRSERVTLG